MAPRAQRANLAGWHRYIHNKKMSHPRFSILLLASLLALSGCDMLPNPQAEAAKQEGEAAAVGTGCRQSGRSIEQCLERNETLSPKSGLVKGWREMDDYMRTNKIEIQKPVEKKTPPKSADGEKSDSESADKPEKPAKEAGASEEKDGSAEKEKAGAAEEGKEAKKSAEH